MRAGTPVICENDTLGIVTEGIDRNGNVGVMLVGGNYAVRYPADELSPVKITVDTSGSTR